MFSTPLPVTEPSGCLNTGISGLRMPSAGLRLGEGRSALLWGGSGILDTTFEEAWESILLGGAGGSLDRVSSTRLCDGMELEEPSSAAVLEAKLTSGRLRPKRAIPALGELSICLEETSMEISVRRAEGTSVLRSPDSSRRLIPVFGDRGLEDSEGDDRVEE